MTRSQTYATLIIVLAVSALVALFFLRGGPEVVEDLSKPVQQIADEAAVDTAS